MYNCNRELLFISNYCLHPFFFKLIILVYVIFEQKKEIILKLLSIYNEEIYSKR